MGGHTPQGLGGRGVRRLRPRPRRLSAPVLNVRPSTSGLLAHAGGFVGHGAGCAGGFIGGLVLIIVVASSHFNPHSVTDKGSASWTSGPGWPISVRGE